MLGGKFTAVNLAIPPGDTSKGNNDQLNSQSPMLLVEPQGSHTAGTGAGAQPQSCRPIAGGVVHILTLAWEQSVTGGLKQPVIRSLYI